MVQHQNNVPVIASASDNTLRQSSNQREIKLAELIGADVLRLVAGAVAWDDKLIPVEILPDQRTLLLFTTETGPQEKEELREKMQLLTNKKIDFIDEAHPLYEEFSSLDINAAIRCCYPHFEQDYDIVIGES
jgi:hypothetical protein